MRASEVLRTYRRFRVPEDINNTPLKDLCRRDHFKLQPQQAFMQEFMGPKGKQTKMILFHKVGSGKTCTAIRIGEAWKKRRHIIVVVPAFLVQNFYNELKGPCTGREYVRAPDDPPDAILARIHSHYTILSYERFTANIRSISLERAVLIIDEAHNMISEKGKFYTTLQKKLKRAPASLRIVLMTATPIFDHPSELALLLNLLLPEDRQLPTGADFDRTFISQEDTLINVPLLRDSLRGLVSYYSGMPAKAFPTLRMTTVSCTMSRFQHKSYLATLRKKDIDGMRSTDMRLRLPISFFIGSRITSNVAFPNGKTYEKGYQSWHGAALRGDNLARYSCKFYQVIQKLKKASKSKKIFVYSNFANYGGIRSLAAAVEANGFEPWDGDGGGSYAVWTREQSDTTKEQIRLAFNDPTSGLNILLGSPSIKEGVTLRGVEQVHIIEPYWNFSRILQVIGRAFRFCVHAHLPPARRVVNVFLYIAVRPDEEAHGDEDRPLRQYSIDRYIAKLALAKKRLTNAFEEVIKQESVDCFLNQSLTRIKTCSH